MTTRRRYEIADSEWERLKKHFPERQDGQLGRPRNDDHQMLNGIIVDCADGSAMGGPAGTIRRKEHGVRPFHPVAKSPGLFAKILEELGEEADLQDMSMDSTSVDAHQHGAGAKKGL